MKVLIDTSAWSLALRRKSNNKVQEFINNLIENEIDIVLPGIVMQELLSGIKNEKQYYQIQEILEDFEFYSTMKRDYLLGSKIKNSLLTKGITSHTIDCLIASISINNDFNLLTLDNDFKYIGKYFNDLKLIKLI